MQLAVPLADSSLYGLGTLSNGGSPAAPLAKQLWTAKASWLAC